MSEPKIIAECWTCAYLRGEWAAWAHGSISNPPDGGIPIDNDRTPTLEIHRAAGHDVRALREQIPYDCAICGRHYTNKEVAQGHARLIHRNADKIEVCPNGPPLIMR